MIVYFLVVKMLGMYLCILSNSDTFNKEFFVDIIKFKMLTEADYSKYNILGKILMALLLLVIHILIIALLLEIYIPYILFKLLSKVFNILIWFHNKFLVKK